MGAGKEAIVIIELRHKIFALYENNVMGTWLGRFRVSRWVSCRLFDILFR